MQIKLKGIFLIPFFVCSFFVSAQQNSVSPYSRLGLGIRQPLNYTRALSLGGASLALYDPLYINNANPASYSALKLTTFEAGLNATFYQQEQRDPDIAIKNFTGGLRYLAAGIPFFDWWSTAVGLQPYSYKGYNIETMRYGPDSIPITDRFIGSGGLNQFYWGNAFKVAEGLSLGVNARYIFGNLEDRTTVTWENSLVNNSAIEELTHASGFNFDAGLQYQYEFEDGHVAGLGLTFANKMNISADVNRYSFVYDNLNRPIDSLGGPTDFTTDITLPSELGIGLSYGKRSGDASLKYSWMLAADFETYKGTEYVNINGTSPLTDGYRAELGGYITPTLAFEGLTRSNGYLGLVEYRLGGFYEKTPLSLAGREILDYGITFGIGMPVIHKNLAPGERKVSMLNAGVILGQRGSLDNGLIREKYVSVYFGISLNDKWFIEYKYR